MNAKIATTVLTAEVTLVVVIDVIVKEANADSMTVVVTVEVTTVVEEMTVGLMAEAVEIPIKMVVTGFVHVVKMTILPEGQNVTGAKPHAQAAVQVEVATAEVATVVEVEISETGVETEVAIAEVATVVEVEISETGVETEVETAEIAETKMAVEIPM
jgi:hypothetical protein